MSSKKSSSTVRISLGRESSLTDNAEPEVTVRDDFVSTNVYAELDDPQMIELLKRLQALSHVDEGELPDLMHSMGALALTGLELRVPTRHLTSETLESWDEVEEASPEPLTDEIYQRFLRGLEIDSVQDVRTYGLTREKR